MCVYEKLGLRSKHQVKVVFVDRRKCVFAETMKERGSMYEHFPLCGSARAAVRGRLLTKPFSDKNRFSENLVSWDFLTFWEGDSGCFRRDFGEFVRILARNPDEKCCQGVN